MEKTWRRHGFSLTEDLASHLRASGWLAYTEIAIRGTGGIVDVAAVKPRHYARKDFRAYEVKESRSDFRTDEGSNKWRRYLQVFHRVYFATPAGLISKDEVPQDAGLIVRGKNGWHVVKAARGHTPPNLGVDAVLAMLFRDYENKSEMRRLADRIVAKENIPLQDKAKNIGYEIRCRLARDKDDEKEKWAYKILEICEKVAGKDYTSSSLSYFDFCEIERILKAALAMRNYAKLLNEMGHFLISFESGWGKGLDRGAEKIKELLKSCEGGGIATW